MYALMTNTNRPVHCIKHLRICHNIYIVCQMLDVVHHVSSALMPSIFISLVFTSRLQVTWVFIS